MEGGVGLMRADGVKRGNLLGLSNLVEVFRCHKQRLALSVGWIAGQ
jgi:hypothetical protein